MRCKNHIADHSSSVGVCASCLRERLVAAQALAQAHVLLAQSLSAAASDPRNSDPYPPPPHHLAFPRSVSPYISRRKSDDSPWHQNHHDHRHHRHRHHRVPSDRRFFSTPQVGPTHGNTAAAAAAVPGKKKRGKFSLFSSIFRSRSDQSDSEPRVSNVSSSSSPNWFSSVIAGRRKKPAPMQDAHPPCRMNDRGMSPDDDSEGSPWASGYSSEAWRTPLTAPASTAGRGRSGHALNVSGLAFCLSPLVRASPGRHRNQKQMPPEAGYSGEIRASNKPHLSSAASYCANRSRKLADFGRSTQNH